MTPGRFLLQSVLLAAIATVLGACDSEATIDNSVLSGGSNEPVAAAALEETSSNLLANGGFESQINGESWRSCTASGSFTTNATSSEGSGALSVSNGACLSQSIAVAADATYTLSCDGRLVDSSGNSSIMFGFLDDSSTSIEVEEQGIITADYASITSTITAPASAVLAEVLISSDGEAVVDNCILIELGKDELLNGDFSEELTGWQICDNTAGDVNVIDSPLESGNKVLSVSNGGCVYQYVDTKVVLESTTDFINTKLKCDTTTDGSGFASITLGYRDANFQQDVRIVEDVISGSMDGVFEIDLLASVDARFTEVQVYSTSFITVDNCSLSY